MSSILLADKIRVKWLMENIHILSDWEENFIFSLMNFSEFTKNQILKIREIYKNRRVKPFYKNMEDDYPNYTFDEVHDFDRD